MVFEKAKALNKLIFNVLIIFYSNDASCIKFFNHDLWTYNLIHMKFELAKMKMLWFFLLAVFTLPAFAQEKSISGTVSDATSRESLIGVTVQVDRKSVV